MILALTWAAAALPGGAAWGSDAEFPLGMAIGFEMAVEVIVGDENDPPPDDPDEWEEELLVMSAGLTSQAPQLLCDPPGGIIIDPAGISTWGQGAGPAGKPNYYLDGAEATFAGGTESDTWMNTGQVRPYADGAVGRCWIRTKANTRTRVWVEPSVLPLMKGNQHINSRAWIGWPPERDGPIYLDWERRWIPRGTKNMWLYVTAERQGLSDAAGTYTGVVTVSIMAE